MATETGQVNSTSLTPRPHTSTDPDTILSSLLTTPIDTTLPSDLVARYISLPPFIPIRNALNLRTITTSTNLPQNRLFRSGALNSLSVASLEALNTEYNITTIFDLRSATERRMAPSPKIENVETIWIETVVDDFLNPERNKKVEEEVSNSKADDGKEISTPASKKNEDSFTKAYMGTLGLYGPVFKAFFERVRDRGVKDGGILYHCAAGKDRTGILSALTLSLCNATPQEIAHDYSLTRIGTEPFRDALLQHLMLHMGIKSIEDLEEKPGMKEKLREIGGCDGDKILGFLEGLDGVKWNIKGKEEWSMGEKADSEFEGVTYPGVVKYLRSLGFSAADLEKIKEQLRQS